MAEFNVIEKFVSIDGEGPTAGSLSVFIRFANCNLRCVWCDTSYAWECDPKTEKLTAIEIVKYIKQTGVKHITLTGGEPLIQKNLISLLAMLSDYEIHIETNGSLDIHKFRLGDNVHFVVDYKLPDSGMEDKMYLSNLTAVKSKDAYKFVIASKKDLDKAIEIVRAYRLDEITQVYFSAVFDKMDPADIIEVMKEEHLNRIKLQLQLHKFIWNKNKRGV
ncbi:MAG: putative 7-carboxy-7-deazaguanine synthase QueE [Bacteroidia bacterium]|nr:putative 7-carboxy-7-deazaguanine synthase QueE [Bacteroidia bacterium]